MTRAMHLHHSIIRGVIKKHRGYETCTEVWEGRSRQTGMEEMRGREEDEWRRR
jgi:hypothetical protein